MSTLTDSSMPDPDEPTFNPSLDVAILVFSHVEHVKTRLNLAQVSKLWLQASKPAAAYPSRFDFDAFPDMDLQLLLTRRICLLDNDEAMSLSYERVVGLLGEPANQVCDYAAALGSLRLLKWARVNKHPWSKHTCGYAAASGQLPALKYLRENGCPWNSYTCSYAACNGNLPALRYLRENGCPWDEYTCLNAGHHKRWDCLLYAVKNKAPEWEYFAEKYANHLTYKRLSS
jgi:hypothetical protein